MKICRYSKSFLALIALFLIAVGKPDNMALPAIAHSPDLKLASNKLSPDLIPPEVTLSNTPPPAPPTSSGNTGSSGNPLIDKYGSPQQNQMMNQYGSHPSAYALQPGMGGSGQNQVSGQMQNQINQMQNQINQMQNQAPNQMSYPGQNQNQPQNSFSNTSQSFTPPPSQGQAPNNTGANRHGPLAIIETNKGNIVILLFQEYAPKTTASFIDLVNKGFYNGLTFHRVEPGFCIQGGCPRGDGFGVYVDPNTKQPRMLPLETDSHLKHNAPGVVAMAHFPNNKDSSSCQFYITLAAEPQLDGDYSIFGGVVQGMDVVNKIAKGDKMNRITIQQQ